MTPAGTASGCLRKCTAPMLIFNLFQKQHKDTGVGAGCNSNWDISGWQDQNYRRETSQRVNRWYHQVPEVGLHQVRKTWDKRAECCVGDMTRDEYKNIWVPVPFCFWFAAHVEPTKWGWLCKDSISGPAARFHWEKSRQLFALFTHLLVHKATNLSMGGCHLGQEGSTNLSNTVFVPFQMHISAKTFRDVRD